MVAGAISFMVGSKRIYLVPSLNCKYGIINLSLSRILSTEKLLIIVITLAHNTIAKINTINHKNAPKIFPTFDLFFTVIILYKFTMRSQTPRKVKSPKKITENVCNNIFVVVGSNPTLES